MTGNRDKIPAIKQLLEAEKELGVWRTKIEEFEGEIRYYSNLVSLSTLTITLAEKEIRAAYRQLAKKLHPDLNPGDKQAEEKFKQVAGAYDLLGDDVDDVRGEERQHHGPDDAHPLQVATERCVQEQRKHAPRERREVRAKQDENDGIQPALEPEEHQHRPGRRSKGGEQVDPEDGAEGGEIVHRA